MTKINEFPEHSIFSDSKNKGIIEILGLAKFKDFLGENLVQRGSLEGNLEVCWRSLWGPLDVLP